jgi:hypothetical protein
MKERTTVTFQPEPDIKPVLTEAVKRGRGALSRLINQALRERLPVVIKNWDRFKGKPPSFDCADGQHVSLSA